MGDTNPIAEPWIVLKLYGAPFFLWSVSALALYSAALGQIPSLVTHSERNSARGIGDYHFSIPKPRWRPIFKASSLKNASIPDVSDSSRMFGTFLCSLVTRTHAGIICKYHSHNKNERQISQKSRMEWRYS